MPSSNCRPHRMSSTAASACSMRLPTACRSACACRRPSNAGADLLYLTGSRAHFEGLQARAADRGLTLTAGGLYSSDRTLTSAAAEADIYAALGLPFIPPEIRDGDDEIALRGSRRAADADLARRHSRRSAHALGLERRTRSDRGDGEGVPSRSATSTWRSRTTRRTLPPRATSRSTRSGSRPTKSPRLRERYPRITILHGCEVDILPDGRLDFPDSVLEALDIVLASLHEHAGHGPDQLMQRYASAMKHPLVTIITHPSNRLVPDPPRLRSRLRSPLRDGRGDRNDPGNRRRAVAPRSERHARAPRHRGRRHGVDRQRLPPRRDAPPSDGTRHRHRPARLGGAAARAERAIDLGRPRRPLPPSAPRADRDPHEPPRTARRVRRRGALVRPVPRDPPAGRRLRRHRIVSDDGGLAADHAARRLPAVLCDRDGDALADEGGAGARAESRLGDRGRGSLRAHRARGRRAVGIDRRGRRRRAAVRGVLHVLEPGDHRRGLRASHRVRRADAAAAPAVGGACRAPAGCSCSSRSSRSGSATTSR